MGPGQSVEGTSLAPGSVPGDLPRSAAGHQRSPEDHKRCVVGHRVASTRRLRRSKTSVAATRTCLTQNGASASFRRGPAAQPGGAGEGVDGEERGRSQTPPPPQANINLGPAPACNRQEQVQVDIWPRPPSALKVFCKGRVRTPAQGLLCVRLWSQGQTDEFQQHELLL